MARCRAPPVTCRRRISRMVARFRSAWGRPVVARCRTQYAHEIARHHRDAYEKVFGPLPSLAGLPAKAGPVADTAWHAAWSRIPSARQEEITRVYANIGKAIAAYERRIEHAPSRF